MYTKDKGQRITLRLNENQFAFVRDTAEMLGISPSEFLRMMVNLSMSSARATSEAVASAKVGLQEKTMQYFSDVSPVPVSSALTSDEKEEESRRENETSDFHNIV